VKLAGRGGCLPSAHEVELVDEVEHIESQIIADHIQHEEFHPDREGDDRPYRQPPAQHEAEYHSERIHKRIDNAVARITLRERLLAVMRNDLRRILQDLPAHFYSEREQESPHERHARKEKPQHPVENKSVDDVREGVPIAEVLGIARAQYHPLPCLHVPARAYEGLAEKRKDERVERENGRGPQHASANRRLK